MSQRAKSPAETVADRLIASLRTRSAPIDGQTLPVAILWTDPKREWNSLAEILRQRLPEYLTLGDYRPEARSGPAVWLRCVVDGALDEPPIPEGRVPILYLPGVARQQLRAGEECPETLKPLVALMFRGALWLHPNGNDWTVVAFFSSPQTLALDVASDHATGKAMQRALPQLALAPLIQLTGKRLAADDFDRMLSGDYLRDLLCWMGDPHATRMQLEGNQWEAFRNRCQEELGFDPKTETEVTAAERVGGEDPRWNAVWERFAEAPTNYEGVAELLQRSRPPGEMPFARERWPDLNEEDEEGVRQEISRLPALAHSEACAVVERLEKEHGVRRGWVWARMGDAPMAQVLKHLARLAAATKTSVGGTTPEDVASAYLERGWQADAATWEAVATAPTADEACVAAAVRCLIEPWLDESARAFQAALERTPLPAHDEEAMIEAGDGGCIFFTDGLRFDLGQRLAERLEASGCQVQLAHRWAALPTVTATAKPAITPVADGVAGEALREDFAPILKQTGQPANARNLRAVMEERGYQVLGQGEPDAPLAHPAHGWLEDGEIDKKGHKLQGQLAHQVPKEIERLVMRIQGLLDAGWQSVQVVTDHGWLLLPGGLPKVDLPKYLTASRWARCAVVAGAACPDALRIPWHWNKDQWFATAPGIACFNKSDEYAHGGLSVQECLTPYLSVERVGLDATAGSALIKSITWRRLRCFAEIETHGVDGGVTAELRKERPLGEPVSAKPKQVGVHGSVSLVLGGDDHEECPLVLVILDEGGGILTHRQTRVGEGS